MALLLLENTPIWIKYLLFDSRSGLAIWIGFLIALLFFKGRILDVNCFVSSGLKFSVLTFLFDWSFTRSSFFCGDTENRFFVRLVVLLFVIGFIFNNDWISLVFCVTLKIIIGIRIKLIIYIVLSFEFLDFIFFSASISASISASS